ncbi:MAG TPA: TIM barrel protein [Tepidisphaeraceae bacterium]|jgi:sugar phosphate isomerase/epimerase|nr:TIM barrel protein [Tepidisphaeraceae bacterium]
MKFFQLCAGLIPLLTLALLSTAQAAAPAKLANPFFAMDTSYRRGNLTHAQQLDLVKELGFAGVTEDLQPPAQMKANLADIEGRGLKLFAVYASARVTSDGDIVIPDEVSSAMNILKDHGTIIWLHIGGKGPAIDSLSGHEPMIAKLRQLSATAKADGLRIAIYPHFGEYTAHLGDAVKLAKTVDHESFGVTFNLCHNLANGDEKEIPALIAAAGPKLFIATIDGADSGVKGADWGRLIQPLGSGTYETRIVLDALAQIHFAGPIGFQGYGIKGDPRAILAPTIKAWTKLTHSSS